MSSEENAVLRRRSRRRQSLRVYSTVAIVLATFADVVTAESIGQRLSKAHLAFSLDFYKQLASTEGHPRGNLVYSPYSINMVLSMLFMGTSSSTDSSTQLRSALHLDALSYVDAHKAFKEVTTSFAEDRYYEHKVLSANALFAAEGVPVSPPYARALKEFYHAEVEHLDFRNADPSATAGAINDWASDATRGRIPSLLDAPPSRDAALVLANALALDVKWLNPFDPNETFDQGLFFLPDGER